MCMYSIHTCRILQENSRIYVYICVRKYVLFTCGLECIASWLQACEFVRIYLFMYVLFTCGSAFWLYEFSSLFSPLDFLRPGFAFATGHDRRAMAEAAAAPYSNSDLSLLRRVAGSKDEPWEAEHDHQLLAALQGMEDRLLGRSAAVLEQLQMLTYEVRQLVKCGYLPESIRRRWFGWRLDGGMAGRPKEGRAGQGRAMAQPRRCFALSLWWP